MGKIRRAQTAIRCLAAGTRLAATLYAAYVGFAWLRYGHVTPPSGDEVDSLLDQFMPNYEVVERHQTHVAAPAETALAAATEIGIQQVPIAGVLFKVRGFLLGGHPDEAESPQGVLAWMKSLGWNELVEVPGREIVIGAVMQPWKASASPRLVPSAEFAEFGEPGYVKIATAFRADPMGADASIFRLESRAVATDPTSRAMFRLYWSLAAPGSVLIRMMARGPIKREAERRAQGAA